MQSYSFSLEGSCAGCGKQLDMVGSVKVNGRDAYVNDDGILLESEDTTLILSDPEPGVICTSCHEMLTVEPQEE